MIKIKKTFEKLSHFLANSAVKVWTDNKKKIGVF